jgi:molybdate transport system ATP-binding protein
MGIEVRINKKLKSFLLDIDFSEASKRIGILGGSGSGKSMTLKSIAGIERPDSGRILLNKRVLYDSAERINITPQKRRVGYLFQNYALFPTMTASENIIAGMRRGNRTEKKQRSEEMMGRFGLEGLGGRYPSELSGGEQQRVALARIMVNEPDVILLDEPFSALDVYIRDRMQEELMDMLSDYAGTVILVSHSRDEIYRFSERLLILDRGKVINHGNTADIFREPGTKTAAMLTGCKNFSAVTVTGEHTMRAEDWGIELRVEGKIPVDTAYIGYRAHEFVPVWGEREENCIRFELASRAELQFEKNFYIKPEIPPSKPFGTEAVITWFVQRDGWKKLEEKGMPSFLRLNEKDILYLKKD